MAGEQCVGPVPETGRSLRNTRRSWRIGVYYSSAEWAAIETSARACGRAPAAFVRETSLSVVPDGPPLLANAALIRDLGRCGNALAGLAATARAGGAMPEAATLEGALAELLAVVRQLPSNGEARGPR